MSIEKVREAIARVKLPDWVKGWRVSEDMDSDNEPMLRVWFQVERDLEFDSDDMRAKHDETQRAQEAIRQAVREAGVDEWLIVVWESAVRN